MLLVIFLNTLTRLGVLPHFIENLSPSRMSLDDNSGKTGIAEQKVSLDQGVLKRTEEEAVISFLKYRGDENKILQAASKQSNRKKFSLCLLH